MKDKKNMGVRMFYLIALLTVVAALAVFSSGCDVVNDDVLPTDEVIETAVPEQTEGIAPVETVIPGETEEPEETDPGSTDAPVETQPAGNTDTPTPAPTDTPIPSPEHVELEYYYIKDTDSYAVIGSGNSLSQVIDIPAEHNGRPVTDVGLDFDWKASDDPDFFAKYCENIESKVDYSEDEALAAENISAFIVLQIRSSGKSVLGAFEKELKVNTFSADVTEIRVPDSVVSVHPYALSGLSALQTLKLGNGVKYLSWQAFSDTGITTIEVPASVSTIDNNFFIEATDSEWKGIYVRGSREDFITGFESTTGNGYETFHYVVRHNYPSLVSITVSGDNSVYKSDGNCLIETNSGTLIASCKTSVIPDYVKSIGFCAFYNVDAPIESVPESVESVAAGAFYGSGIRSAIFGSAMKNIGEYAFFDCKSLVEVVVPGSVKRIATNAFAYCEGLRSLILQAGITTIEDSAFQSCKLLSSLVLPDGVTSLGQDAFAGCGIKTLMIGEGPEIIGATVFGGNPIESVTFPGSLKGFECYAPYYGDWITLPFSMPTLKEIVVPQNNGNLVMENNCLINKTTKSVLLCLSGYKIPSWVEKVEVYAFGPLPNSEKIVIPVNIIKLGGTFSQNTGYYPAIMRDAYYEGTISQFKMIDHGGGRGIEEVRDCAITPTVTCTDGSITYKSWEDIDYDNDDY